MLVIFHVVCIYVQCIKLIYLNIDLYRSSLKCKDVCLCHLNSVCDKTYNGITKSFTQSLIIYFCLTKNTNLTIMHRYNFVYTLIITYYLTNTLFIRRYPSLYFMENGINHYGILKMRVIVGTQTFMWI